eukprot:750495-Hanusia_phi.AAC.2
MQDPERCAQSGGEVRVRRAGGEEEDDQTCCALKKRRGLKRRRRHCKRKGTSELRKTRGIGKEAQNKQAGTHPISPPIPILSSWLSETCSERRKFLWKVIPSILERRHATGATSAKACRTKTNPPLQRRE